MLLMVLVGEAILLSIIVCVTRDEGVLKDTARFTSSLNTTSAVERLSFLLPLGHISTLEFLRLRSLY